MTKQSYEVFAKKLQDDAAMRQELQTRFGSADQGLAPKDLAEFAAGKGYQFEVDEVPGELSERELEGASGGVTAELRGAGLDDRAHGKSSGDGQPAKRKWTP